MVICTCGKVFHACSSCDLNHIWEYKYCSEKCWKESDECIDAINHMTNVIDALPNDCGCLDDLAYVLDGCGGDYYGTFVGLLMDKKRLIKGDE